MLIKLLDRFEGKLTTSKWTKVTKRAQVTAHRDSLTFDQPWTPNIDRGDGSSIRFWLGE